jgi:hypothetical protein
VLIGHQILSDHLQCVYCQAGFSSIPMWWYSTVAPGTVQYSTNSDKVCVKYSMYDYIYIQYNDMKYQKEALHYEKLSVTSLIPVRVGRSDFFLVMGYTLRRTTL